MRPRAIVRHAELFAERVERVAVRRQFPHMWGKVVTFGQSDTCVGSLDLRLGKHVSEGRLYLGKVTP